jgi:short-subunit dehydrogenase
MRRALVTGASSGIGLHVARRLAARGIDVWLAARRKELLDAAVAEINAAGRGKAHALVLDVADVDAVVATLGKLDDEVGGIDLVVANAGLAGARGAIPLPKCEWADIRDMFQINTIGAAATLYPFISRMVARGHGHFVGISSVGADCPIARAAPYGASKAALTFFLESADIELRPLGIDVTIIHPGFTKTAATDALAGTTPMPFMVPVETMAKVIDRAIIKRRRLVRHPWILGFVARVTAWLPRFIMSPLIRKTSG